MKIKTSRVQNVELLKVDRAAKAQDLVDILEEAKGTIAKEKKERKFSKKKEKAKVVLKAVFA